MEILIAAGVVAALVLWKRRSAPGGTRGGVERGQAAPHSQSGGTPGGAMAAAAKDAQHEAQAVLDRFSDLGDAMARYAEDHPAAAAAGGILQTPGVVDVAHYGDAGQSPRAR